LSARLAESRDHSDQAKQAHELIQQGEFDKAETILQGLATKEEDDVARAAATQYDLGDMARRHPPPSRDTASGSRLLLLTVFAMDFDCARVAENVRA
jgi:hypothetical protein